jgi:hypothetical protein
VNQISRSSCEHTAVHRPTKHIVDCACEVFASIYSRLGKLHKHTAAT